MCNPLCTVEVLLGLVVSDLLVTYLFGLLVSFYLYVNLSLCVNLSNVSYVLHQLATQWCIEIIFIIDHCYMQTLNNL